MGSNLARKNPYNKPNKKGWKDGKRYQSPSTRLKKLYQINKETSSLDDKYNLRR